jgi:hypothetical protein
MSVISFSKGDFFTFEGGFGIALNKVDGILIKGQGGRTGWTTEKSQIPHDALPNMHGGAKSNPMPFEVKMALEAVKVTIS